LGRLTYENLWLLRPVDPEFSGGKHPVAKG